MSYFGTKVKKGQLEPTVIYHDFHDDFIHLGGLM